ncbi:hypothetical protein AZA_29554 [Nitrospirillum viridazoti Y2]|nr:hypothetical protein AZA_29554 [Nitrospirillum amazonense Y2]
MMALVDAITTRSAHGTVRLLDLEVRHGWAVVFSGDGHGIGPAADALPVAGGIRCPHP